MTSIGVDDNIAIAAALPLNIIFIDGLDIYYLLCMPKTQVSGYGG